MKFFIDRVNFTDILYDIGAFRGVYSMAVSNRHKGAVAIHLFEPIPENIESIERICSLNQFRQIDIVSKAVGSGETMNCLFSASDGMLRARDISDQVTTDKVFSISLDAYINETGVPPTIIKIDVEGFELEVLQGARECLFEHGPHLWLELHPTFLAGRGNKWEDVIEFVKSRNYKSFHFYEDYRLPTRASAFHVWCEK